MVTDLGRKDLFRVVSCDFVDRSFRHIETRSTKSHERHETQTRFYVSAFPPTSHCSLGT